jgi:hypothetical protein
VARLRDHRGVTRLTCVAHIGGDDLGQRVRGARQGGPWLRKGHAFETDHGGRRRETTENPQVKQDQDVTRSETLQMWQ